MFTVAEKEARRLTLGASEMAAALGLNPYCSPHQLWLKKLGLVDDEENIRTRAGELIEPIVRQLYCEETGADVASFGTIVHPREKWLSATPDGAVWGVRRLLEIKVVGHRVAFHWTEKEDGIPDYYRAQVETQMEVCDADECDVAALIGGTTFRIYRIRRDRDLARHLIERARRFWAYVENESPPPVDGSEGAREMLKHLYPTSAGYMRRATDEEEAMAERLIESKDALRIAEIRCDHAANALRQRIGEDDGIFGDTWKATWKPRKDGVRVFNFKTRGEE